MALPTLVKTWQFNVNNTISTSGAVNTDGGRVLLLLKQALMGFGSSAWTMRYSCNSVTAGSVGDGVDRVTAQANFVWGVNGSVAHSWMVLRQTGVGSNMDMLIACDSPSNSANGLTISFSLGGNFTGGTTTSNPTATDGTVIMSSAGNNFMNSTLSNMRAHAMMSSDGAITRFILTTSAPGTPGPQFLLAIEQLTNLVAGWTLAPVIGLGTGSGNSATRCMGSVTLCSQVWLARPIANACSGSMIMEGANAVLLPVLAANQVANEIDGSWPMLPIAFFSQTATLRGRHGTLIDIWGGSEAIAYGDTYPNNTTYQFAQFGCIIVPWNGVIPLL